MNPIEKLRADLAKRFPDSEVAIDAPADPSGFWHLDVRPGGDRPWIVIEWKSSFGFGVSTPDDDEFGTKPDEIHPNARAAYDRVVQLILGTSRELTGLVPPPTVDTQRPG